MPNEVYLRTRAGLATLVSPRAATRMLDEALRRAGLSADGLGADAVHDLLLGPVRVELEGILPHGSLRRTLRRLARTVRAETRASTPGRRTPTLLDRLVKGGARSLTPPERYDSQRVFRSSVHLPDIPDLDPPALARGHASGSGLERDPLTATPVPPPAPPAPLTGTAGHATIIGVATADAPTARVAAATAPSERLPTAAQTAPATTRALGGRGFGGNERRNHPTLVPADPGPAWPSTVAPRDGATVERIVLGYAALDGVLQVAAVREHGDVAFARGNGVDTTALGPLLRTSLHLLGRHGRLRSLVLEHAAGLLFVFPFGTDTIVVLTRPTVNIGAVFAARTALQEGL